MKKYTKEEMIEAKEARIFLEENGEDWNTLQDLLIINQNAYDESQKELEKASRILIGYVITKQNNTRI